MGKKDNYITFKEIDSLQTKHDVFDLLETRSGKRASKLIKTLKYEEELETLQIELGKLQQWIVNEGKRLAIIFEGRDAAGKGGTIKRFIQHLNPRQMNVVALAKPTDAERGQWYFRRYIKRLPNAGEIAFFDRSWYNRAVVEPVNGFCTENQYKHYMNQVNQFEHMLHDDGLILIKFWLDITKEEQKQRFDDRRENPLKRWKISPIDEKAQDLWDAYTHYRDAMFEKTSSAYSPWIIIRTDKKKEARIAAIKYALNKLDYPNKTDENLTPNENVIFKYERKLD